MIDNKIIKLKIKPDGWNGCMKHKWIKKIINLVMHTAHQTRHYYNGPILDEHV